MLGLRKSIIKSTCFDADTFPCCMSQLLYYQFIPKLSLNVSDLENGVAYQTILFDQQLTVCTLKALLSLSCTT